MPQVVIEIQHLISDFNSEISQLTAIIETDQAIATKVLKTANSAFYGMSGKISSIHQAFILLGYQVLGEIILDRHILENMDQISIYMVQDEISGIMLKALETVDRL